MRPLRGAMISIQKVETSKAIQIHNVENVRRETLDLYFENKRHSGGGLFTVVEEACNGSYVILEFETPNGKLIYVYICGCYIVTVNSFPLA